MNEKEIAELRRRIKPEKCNISRVQGCYVNEKGEIVSAFSESITMMPEGEAEKLLGVLKKTLSGTHRKNLLDLEFSTQQVVDSEEHRLLMALRQSALEDKAALETFYQTVIEARALEGNYLILLAYDRYDVPFHSADGQRQDDAGSEQFSYILCSICPVKETKPQLGYHVYENAFCTSAIDWLVTMPEMGFLFPGFEERSTNIYGALYYAKDASENHPEFVEQVFHLPLPMPATAQRETFETLLEETLSENCSMGVVQAVHGELCEMIETHKANKEVEPLNVSKGHVERVLKSCGVLEERVAAFSERYDEAFGADALLSPKNLVDSRQLEVVAPNVSIKVKAESSSLVKTSIINGVKYVLVRVEDGVEVNGVMVQIAE